MSRRHSDRSRDRSSRERTVSVSLADRGQTTQDFAVGIGVFLLTIAFVFTYVPSFATPYESSVGGAETAQADRIADRIVENTTDTEMPNEIDGGEYRDTYADVPPSDLVEAVGLRASEDDDVTFDRVNITIESFEDGPEADWSGGQSHDNQTAASSARIVTVDDSDEPDINCDPACRLVVRVW